METSLSSLSAAEIDRGERMSEDSLSPLPLFGPFRQVGKMARPGQSGEKVLLCGAGDRRCARRSLQLSKDVRDVPMHGVLAEKNAFGDRLVRQTLRDEPKHFPFAPGER
jgi:hypothetical protein